MKVEFINDNKLDGIKYDFDLIRKDYTKLKCPKKVYNPNHIPYESNKWNIILSDRSRGKTTNILLFGLCMFWRYRNGLLYIRNDKSMITQGNVGRLFNTVIEWGYVEKLTGGEYDGIIYKSMKHEWYFVKYDSDGEIEKEDNKPCCIALSIDQNERYKSNLVTTYDFVVYDEFIERVYTPSLFISLVDLLKTIGRDRQSMVINALSNTVDLYSPFFSEFGISDVVETMNMGDRIDTLSPFGTHIFVEILGEKKGNEKIKHTKVNQMYYGFKNPKLASVTGTATWAMYNYPHTPEKLTIIKKNHYIHFMGKLINMELCQDDNGVVFVNCHIATKTYDDSIIYSLDFHTEPNYRYKKGFTKIDDYIWDKYEKNLFTYSNNSVGSMVEKYLDGCKTDRKR